MEQKLLFIKVHEGGDYFPHPNIKEHMPNDGALVDLLGLFSNDGTILKKILVDNPIRLYWNSQ